MKEKRKSLVGFIEKDVLDDFCFQKYEDDYSDRVTTCSSSCMKIILYRFKGSVPFYEDDEDDEINAKWDEKVIKVRITIEQIAGKEK